MTEKRALVVLLVILALLLARKRLTEEVTSTITYEEVSW